MGFDTEPMAPIPGKAFMNRVIERVYEVAQLAHSREEYELSSLNLRLLSEVLKGNSEPWLAACYAALGSSFEQWRERTQERKARMAVELNRARWQAARTTSLYEPKATEQSQLLVKEIS